MIFYQQDIPTLLASNKILFCQFYQGNLHTCNKNLEISNIRNKTIFIVLFMKIIDTHAHFDCFIRKNNIGEVLDRAKQNGIARIIVPSASPENWNEYEKLAKDNPNYIDWQIGIHPSDIDENSHLALDALSTFFTSNTPPCAIGEIGLDYYYLPKDKTEANNIVKLQKEIFIRQINLAKDMQCPICVHARNAVDDAIKIIEECDFDFSKVVFHCYAGNLQQLKILNNLGGRASFTGIITFSIADEMRECLLDQDVEKLMFETDTPYLSPVPLRKHTNEPSHIVHTVEFASNLLKIPAKELAEITTKNAIEFFRL